MMSGGTEFSSHFYSLSRDTIDEIRRAIKEVLPAGQGVSANDAISALVNVAVAQCLECPAPGDPPSGLLQRTKAAIFGAHKPQLKVFEHMGAADVRPRLKMDPENAYCGSAIVLYTSNIPLDELQGPVTPRMLALVATATRKGTDSIDKGYIYAHAATIAKEPDCTMRPFAYGTGPPAHLVMTNHSRIGHYHVDFGWGTPVWANVIEETMSSLCYVLPPPPGRDGNVIHMMIPKDVQTRMQQLPFWKDKTKLIR
ncbi:hypothetical protein LPJ61_003950 [Coemansia biformis]|uniref:Uncharacterized protein n=1 Tax=Coemansia biformis TaxID=1286918 RepID=A0A9W8CXR3_9FUNG|nr:hypothetical protein LPJ61_003950 [Coemansia biformis]